MAGEVAMLLAEVAELRRRVAGTQYAGVVSDVKGDRVRVEWGRDSNGNPVLSPWLETSDHRGGARERRYFKKGQNVTVSTVDGQMDEAATVSSDAPNESYPPPDQAEDAGAESETYQFDELRVTKKADSYQIYFGKDAKTKILIEKKGRVTILCDEADGLVTIKTSKKVLIETPDVEVKAKNKVYIETPLVEMSRDLRVRGNVNVDGYVYAVGDVRAVNRVRLATHTHGGVDRGDSNTNPPN